MKDSIQTNHCKNFSSVLNVLQALQYMRDLQILIALLVKHYNFEDHYDILFYVHDELKIFSIYYTMIINK